MFDFSMSELEQGSLINKINSPWGVTAGVVITARCDIAQEKINVITVLPIEPLSKWMLRVGAPSVRRASEKALQKEMGDLMDSNGLPSKAYKQFSLESLLEKVVFRKPTEKGIFSSKIEAYWKYARNDALPPELKSVVNERSQLIKNLVGQNIHGAYFVENIPLLGGKAVIDLRSPISIAIEVFKLIEKGLDCPRYDRHIDVLRDSIPKPEIGSEIRICGVMSSPYIESLLQKFSMTFSRIGLPDMDIKKIIIDIEKELAHA
jgi:hypothetical protein